MERTSCGVERCSLRVAADRKRAALQISAAAGDWGFLVWHAATLTDVTPGEYGRSTDSHPGCRHDILHLCPHRQRAAVQHCAAPALACNGRSEATKRAEQPLNQIRADRERCLWQFVQSMHCGGALGDGAAPGSLTRTSNMARQRSCAFGQGSVHGSPSAPTSERFTRFNTKVVAES